MFATAWVELLRASLRYSASEAIGQPITLVIPQDRQGEEREILTRIRRGERIDHFETVRQRKNGVSIVVSLTVSPVKDANGKIVGASKIARDITEQKKNQDRSGFWHARPSNAARTTCERISNGQSFSVELARRSQRDNRGTHPGTSKCLLAFRGNALDRCRDI